MNVLRWLLVVPAALAGVYAGVGVFFYRLRAVLLPCSSDPVALVECAGPWFFRAEVAADSVGAMVASVLSPVLAAAVAPRHKARVAYMVAPCVLFCVVTIVVLLGVSWPGPLICAGVGSVIALSIARRLEVSAP